MPCFHISRLSISPSALEVIIIIRKYASHTAKLYPTPTKPIDYINPAAKVPKPQRKPKHKKKKKKTLSKRIIKEWPAPAPHSYWCVII